ncbi:aldo/keto reductase [Lachnospiraceae bacterium 47-T17]
MKKLGFGCMRLPVLGESKDFMSAEDIDLAQFCQMVDTFMERGFTYFDTSYVYHNGKSEVFLKEALVKRYPRESFLLADKLPTFSITSPEQVPVIFEEQLERCGVSYFDYYLLHNIWETNYDTNIVPCDEFGFACRMKKEGKIRHLGMSFHDSPEALDRILTEHPEVEFVQIALNYYDWDSELVQSRRCYEVIRRHNRQVIVMQPVKGGMLVQVPDGVKSEMEQMRPGMTPASWAVRFAAGLEGVIVVLSGMSNLQQIEDNTSYMQEFLPLSRQEQDFLKKAVEVMKQSKTVACSQCQKCDAACPKNIHISDILGTYNTIMRQREQGLDVNVELNYYRPLKRRQHGGDICDGCGKCSEVCPMQLDVVRELKHASEFQDEHSFW